MAKKFVWITLMLLLCAGSPRAFALGSLEVVTKATQAELGLHFSLVAERVSEEAVLVRMEIPRKGKLKNLRSVGMNIGGGTPMVAATLQTTVGPCASWGNTSVAVTSRHA